jgi:P27 family predicted phage terminase small subunit
MLQECEVRRMGKRGPKPTHLRVLEGNPGKRGNPKNEPKPEPGELDPPDFLDELGVSEWNRIAPSLKQHGLLTAWDRSMLAAYCDAYGNWVKVTREVAALGSLTVTVGENGYQQQHPAVALQNRYFETMRKTAALFGLSPSDRHGLEVKEPVEETTMARLLREARK